MTKQEQCLIFNCTMEQLNAQYKRNIEGLEKMHIKAKSKGKYNGYTPEQIEDKISEYKLKISEL